MPANHPVVYKQLTTRISWLVPSLGTAHEEALIGLPRVGAETEIPFAVRIERPRPERVAIAFL